MSSGDGKDELPSEADAKIIADHAVELSESKKDSPCETVIDGSGDYTTVSTALSTSSVESPDKGKKDSSPDSPGSHKVNTEISLEDHNSKVTNIKLNIDAARVSSEDKFEEVIEQPVSVVSEADISPCKETIEVPSKPTFLEDVGSSATELDSENQDEELVLKWDDDDDEEGILSKDVDNDKKLEENSKSNDNETGHTSEIESVSERPSLKVPDSKLESKSSKYDLVDDDQEDLLSEIDAQIAELGASLSKAENENEAKIPPKKLNKASESRKSSNLDKVIDITEEISNLDTISIDSEMENPQPTDIGHDVEDKDKVNKSNKAAEMEIEEALLEDEDDLIINDYSEQFKSIDKPQTSDNVEVIADPIVDSSDKTQEIIDVSSKMELKIQMEIEKSIDLETSSTSIVYDQEILKTAVIQANSTKLDDSEDLEMEVSGKDDTFAHDSSCSIDEKPHGVNKEDVMIEIPTQELLDLDESETSLHNKDMSLDVNELSSNISVELTNEPSELSKKIVLEVTSTASTDKHEHSAETKQLGDTVTKEKQIGTLEESAQKISDAALDEKTTQSTTLPKDQTSDLIIIEKDVITPNQKGIEIKENVLQENAKLPRADSTVSNDATSTEADIILPGMSISSECKESPETKTEDSLDDNVRSSKENISTGGKDLTDVQPSTSQMEPPQQDPSDDAAEVAEVTDSLGLLAESSFVRDEDDDNQEIDDQETSDHDDDDDEDDDPDDDSSNLQTAEQSEDSAQHSEPDLPTTQEPTEPISTLVIDEPFTLLDKEAEEETTVDEEAETIGKEMEEKEFDEEIRNDVSDVGDDTKDGEMDIEDDIVCDEVEVTSDNVEDIVTAQVEEIDTSLKDKSDVTAETNEPESDLSKPDSQENAKMITLTKEPVEKNDSMLRTLLEKAEELRIPTKKLEIVKPKDIVSIVDLESSSEDEAVSKPTEKSTELTSVNISSAIEVMSLGDNTSDIISKQGETIITVPKNQGASRTPARLNTSEITIKTASTTEPLVIPEKMMGSKFGALEVFNLDSDEEDAIAPPVRDPTPEVDKPLHKCINANCTSDSTVPHYPADSATAAYYECRKKKRAMVCENCLYKRLSRAQRLVEGIKSFAPLLSLSSVRHREDLVEISDSESDDEVESLGDVADRIPPEKAGLLEQQLAAIINETWDKFKMDARMKEVQDELTADMEMIEKESEEVNRMLDECQAATDKLRGELYATFEVRRHQLPGLLIYDTPHQSYTTAESKEIANLRKDETENQQSLEPNKRRLSSASESQAKKPALPPSAAEEEPYIKTEDTINTSADSKVDDDKEVSVVTLSAEAAPPDLPPPGDAVRPPLEPGQRVFAMRHAFGSWITASVLEIMPMASTGTTGQNFTTCRVKFENKTSRNAYKVVPARCLAYLEPANVRLTIGTRVIALFKDTSADKSGKKESFYSGVVSEVPNPVNKYRYLVFFDDGYAQYVQHSDTRLVCESSSLVWEEVHPFSREFVREYLLTYPERPMVRLHTGQSLKTEWNGKWWLSRVIAVDGSLAQVYFEQDKRTEWIYRGSTRLAPLYLELQAAEKHRMRPRPRNSQTKLNMPYVEYTRYDEQQDSKASEAQIKAQQEEIRRQRAVAKKSTTPQNLPPKQATPNLDAVTSRVVYYTPKNAVKPYKMTTHTCGPKCKRTDVLALKDLRTYNPLAKPLLSGWERQIVRFKGHKEAMYRAPCGRRLRNMAELHKYLRTVNSDMGVDLFDFGPNTHCLAEFVLNKCIVGKKDLSHGKENVPVPCVNYYDESLPEFCSYNTVRTPTAGVPLNVDPEFLCGCDCTDDCQDKSACACWQMTLEGARTIGMDTRRVGYVYKRLPDPLPSGIYECNSRCKCKATCLNRVAQHPLQLKLQVFKTLNRGWGIRALNDVPKGCFLCIYAGNLLTDATANLDGLNEGDEYLAELDYIEVVEQMKEGYEDDIPEQDKKLDRKELGKSAESESEETESEEEAANSKSDEDDGDFEPGFIPSLIVGFNNKRLRKRDKKKQKKENGQEGGKAGKEGEDDCITISDDEELREPSRFAAQAGMGGEFISKYKSVRTLFGRDEACYIMDAKVQGNIGRYLNHSCSPNVFVQNVFVDTHDPRFPWVAFFALTHIRAGTELTWNYNYDVGSVPGKALYCYCGAPNCRGRLL